MKILKGPWPCVATVVLASIFGGVLSGLAVWWLWGLIDMAMGYTDIKEEFSSDPY